MSAGELVGLFRSSGIRWRLYEHDGAPRWILLDEAGQDLAGPRLTEAKEQERLAFERFERENGVRFPFTTDLLFAWQDAVAAALLAGR